MVDSEQWDYVLTSLTENGFGKMVSAILDNGHIVIRGTGRLNIRALSRLLGKNWGQTRDDVAEMRSWLEERGFSKWDCLG